MWNNVLQNFINLKRAFINMFGEDMLWDYNGYPNCIAYWSAKCGNQFEEMFAPLIVTEHKDFVLLRYNLLDADADFWEKYDGMYRECRSVVIDIKNECLVLTPFRKFFNVNETDETAEHKIRKRINEAKYIEVSDKMDGSMQSARYYNGNVVLAGSQALDPELSFRVAIGYSLLDQNYRMMLMENPNYTFIFELICKEDQHVVVYSDDERGLYLLGIRNVITGEELSYANVIAIAQKYGVRHTKTFDKTFDQLMQSLDEKTSDEAEGFVINIDGYKVKLKYNDYVKIHRMLSKMVSTNTIIKCIDDGSWDDVRSKMPIAYRADADIVANNVKAFIKMMTSKMYALYDESKNSYKKFNGAVDRKSFAIYVLEHHKSYAHYLLNMYDGKDNNFIRNRAGRYLKYHEILQAFEKQ